jgi:DNA-binding IscR family transcriptional regulator
MAANSQFSMAVHVLSMLARSKDENVKSECLASSVNTNAVVIRRLLGQLNQANLVVSQTGVNGGTRLARCPKEINLSEIYKAVNCGDVFALHAKSPSKDCPVGRTSKRSSVVYRRRSTGAFLKSYRDTRCRTCSRWSNKGRFNFFWVYL